MTVALPSGKVARVHHPFDPPLGGPMADAVRRRPSAATTRSRYAAPSSTRMRAKGEEPYRLRFDVDARAAELVERYAGLGDGEDTADVVSVAGRVVAIRDQGKAVFLVLRDATGDVQLFCRVNVLGEGAFARVKDLDLGDWVGATGTVVRTRRGELSVAPVEVVLLSKSLRPLPEKFHGLADAETRLPAALRRPHRQSRGARHLRQALRRSISAIRRYMDGLGYVEVETPMLHPIPGGATARPFVTHHNALDMDALPAHRSRALPEAAARGRLRRACTRSTGRSATRGCRCGTTPSSRCSRRTRRSPTCAA